MYILTFASILGWTLFLSNKNPKYSALYPFLVITSTIVFLFLASILRILPYVSYGLTILGIALPLYLMVTRKFDQKFLKSLPASYYVFSALGFLWFFFTIKAVIFGADEFAWGQFTKVLVSQDALYSSASAIMQGKANYPPGISLFQYHFMSFSDYSEPAVFFSQGIFALSAVLPIYDFIGKNLKKILIFTLAIAMALVYFGPGLLSMTNDHIIGSAFALAMLANFFFLRSLKSKLLLIPIVFSLPLIKTTGIILSLIISFAAAIEILLSAYSSDKKNIRNVIWKSLLIIVILGCFSYAPVKMWNGYLAKQGETGNPTPSLSKIVSSFSQNATEREKKVLVNFKRDLITRPINFQEGEIKSEIPIYKSYLSVIKRINLPPLGSVTWIIIFIALFGMLSFSQQGKARVASFIRLIVMVGGFALYAFFHLLAYMYYFSDYEAFKLAAMDRYFSSYFLGLSLILIGYSANVLREKSVKAKSFVMIASIFIIFMLIFHTPTLIRLIVPPSMMAQSTEIVRSKTRPFSSEINSKTPAGSRIWVIYQNTKGWECMMMRYDIVPIIMNGGSGNWSLGEKYGPNDVWTHNLAPEDWSKQILEERYDYVYLAYTDDNFWNRYSGLFEQSEDFKTKRLFKVEDKEGQVRLKAE